MKWAYLLIMLFTLSYPLYKSFEDKINYHSKWKFVFKSTLPVALFFILWDNWFTYLGVWNFNPDFVLGIYLLKLPVEEYLFFFFVPFSCIFIYEVMIYFVPKDILKNYTNTISWSIIILSMILLILYMDRIYPIILFSLTILILIVHLFIIKANYMGRFYLSFAVCIVPFLLVNGFLTALPILRYKESDIMGIRIYTIPLEDLFYGMLFLMLVTSFYEFFKKKDDIKQIRP